MALRLVRALVKPLLAQSEAPARKLASRGFLYLGNKHFSAAEASSPATASSNTPKDKRGLTKDDPVLVASTSDKCIVGCNCGPDRPTIKWFFVEEGPAQVCECGYYFKLDKVKEGQWIPEHSRFMSVDKNLTDARHSRKSRPFKHYNETVVIDQPSQISETQSKESIKNS